ncbi:MAG: histidine kinase N-terminal domain-containing protein, partial [Acidimicrobiales bacterium]
MTTPAEQAGPAGRTGICLDVDALEHLQRLMGSWGMLADLSFSDLLLVVPVEGSDGSRFMVLGQMRPSTSQTLHRDDMVGRIMDEVERPWLTRSWRRGEILEGELSVRGRGERARIQCIPVRHAGLVVALVAREAPFGVGRRPGELERVYVELFERFARMIFDGVFPFASDEAS